MNSTIRKRRGLKKKLIGKIRFLLLIGLSLSSTVQMEAASSNDKYIDNGLQGSGKTLTGKVSDSYGWPIPGVSVVLKGTAIGTITDADGVYVITDLPEEGVLVFSFVGMSSQEMSIVGLSTLDIILKEELIGLNEIVAVGYGVQKKVNVTGAISSIESGTLENKSMTSLSSGMQGLSSGVTVTQSSGQPGADKGEITIRGMGSINGGSPLVLVDGMEFDMEDVDPSDIESISVLKDAAASSIYGVRAASGVILITTKRGSEGKTELTYSGYVGIQETTQLPNFVGAQQYMKLVNKVYTNSGGSEYFTSSDIAAYDDPNRNTDLYPDVNWMDEILQGSGIQQEHSLALTSGNDKMKYRLSFNSLDQEGLVKKTNFNRTTVRLNTDIQAFDRLHISADVSAKMSKRTEPQGSGTVGGMWFQFNQAYATNPTIPVKYSDGTWGIGRSDGNPVRLQEEGGQYTYKESVMAGNFRADLDIVDGLKVSGIASLTYETDFNYMVEKALTYTDFFNKSESVVGVDNTANESYRIWNTNIQGLLNYNKTFGDHTLGVLAGIQAYELTSNYLKGYSEGGSLDQLDELDAGDASTDQANGNENGNSLLSYFGRVNYSYAGKYLFEGNIRRDGSSHFSEDNRWGTFPSFSAGWRMSEEPFLDFTDNYLSNFKIRASWGQLGNQSVTDDYAYQSRIGLGYNYPYGGNVNSGAKQTNAANAAISWEVTEMSDIGFDFGFLNNKLYGTFDYFDKRTKDMLLALDISATVGLDAPYQNVGTMTNKGWEFSIGYRGSIGSDFKYNVLANISDVKNNISDIKDRNIVYSSTYNTTIVQESQPYLAFYGYVAEGIFQSDEEVANHAVQSAGVTSAGDIKYKNISGDDDAITSEDRAIIGSNIPHYTYSLNLNAKYKNFDLSALFQGVGKVDVNTLQANHASTSTDGNFKEIHLDSWSEDNTDAAFPRLTSNTINYAMSSFWIKSGSYLRLKTLQLGYTIPNRITGKVGISKCRFYANGQNLFTWSNLNDYNIDPEMPQDARYYPQVKTYSLGVNVTF